MKENIKNKIVEVAELLEKFDNIVMDNPEIFERTNLKLHNYYLAKDLLKKKGIELSQEKFDSYFELFCSAEFEYFQDLLVEKGLKMLRHHSRSDIFLVSEYDHDILTTVQSGFYCMEDVIFEELVCAVLEVEGYCGCWKNSFTSYENMVKEIINENIQKDCVDGFEDYLKNIENLLLAIESVINEFLADTFKELKEVHNILSSLKETVEYNLCEFIMESM